METAAGIYSRIIQMPDQHTGQQPSASQKAMLDATPDCIKVVSPDGRLLTMNRAGCVALNVPEDSEFGMPWLPLLPADVHSLGQEALSKAAAGQPARFPGKSLSPTGLTYWDNLLTPMLNASGKVQSILCVSRDITVKTILEQQLKEAVERERLLSREMQHRIKNLFSLVSGLIAISEREAGSSNTPGAAMKILREKLGALSRASDAAFSSGELGENNAERVPLDAITRSVLMPYTGRCETNTDGACVRRDSMTMVALFIHEFATNSMKYGALSRESGHIAVDWASKGTTLNMKWIESGGPQISLSPERQGFGTEMVNRLVRSAGGTINRIWQAEGLAIELELPGFASA